MRPEKATIVSELSDKLKASPFVLVADYQRMKVTDFGELRTRLDSAGAEVHVVKNNFLKRAMSDSGFPDVSDKLMGQTAVVTGKKDVAPVAKIFKKFATEFKVAALKVGLIDRSVVSTAELEALADLPAREVLLAQFLGLLMAPATRLVRVLNEPGSAFARLLNAKAKSMPAEAAKPAAAEKPAAPAPEAPAATAAAPAEPEAPAAGAPEATKAEAAAPEAPKAEATETAPAAEAPKPEEPKPTTEGAA